MTSFSGFSLGGSFGVELAGSVPELVFLGQLGSDFANMYRSDAARDRLGPPAGDPAALLESREEVLLITPIGALANVGVLWVSPAAAAALGAVVALVVEEAAAELVEGATPPPEPALPLAALRG